jgi:hypothetical protein
LQFGQIEFAVSCGQCALQQRVDAIASHVLQKAHGLGRVLQDLVGGLVAEAVAQGQVKRHALLHGVQRVAGAPSSPRCRRGSRGCRGHTRLGVFSGGCGCGAGPECGQRRVPEFAVVGVARVVFQQRVQRRTHRQASVGHKVTEAQPLQAANARLGLRKQLWVKHLGAAVE